MKRFFLALFCTVFFISLVIPPVLADTENTICTINLGNGLTATDITYVTTQSRSIRSAKKTRTIKDGNTLIAEITIEGLFSYDGNSSEVLSKSVIQSDTYDGWHYKQNSFTDSEGTILLNAKITKLLSSQSFIVSLACDPNGNIS